MVYSKKVYRLAYLLIFIVIIISTAFLHELQFRRKLFSQDHTTIEIALPIDSPRCVVETRYFTMTIDACKGYATGRAVSVTGRVEQNSDDGLLERKRLIVEAIAPYKLKVVSPKSWRLLYQHQVLVLRQMVRALLQESLPPYQAGLVLAVVFGTTDWLASNIKPIFEITGTLHILAASGQNISLLLLLVEPLIPSSTPTKLKAALLLFAVTTYLAVVGLQPSLVRATVMASLLLLSRYYLFTQYSALYALVVSVPLILLFRPEWMIAIGLWLSVCATIGIILLYPFFIRCISSTARQLKLQWLSNLQNTPNTISSYFIESSAAGVAAQAATFPLLFSQIGTVQLLAFIPTTVVSWLLPILMTYTMIVLATARLSILVPQLRLISNTVAMILVWLPTDLFLHLLEYLARWQWGVIHNPWLEQ